MAEGRKRKPSLELGRCNPWEWGWWLKELLGLRLPQMPMHYIRHKNRKRVKGGGAEVEWVGGGLFSFLFLLFNLLPVWKLLY